MEVFSAGVDIHVCTPQCFPDAHLFPAQCFCQWDNLCSSNCCCPVKENRKTLSVFYWRLSTYPFYRCLYRCQPFCGISGLLNEEILEADCPINGSSQEHIVLFSSSSENIVSWMAKHTGIRSTEESMFNKAYQDDIFKMNMFEQVKTSTDWIVM